MVPIRSLDMRIQPFALLLVPAIVAAAPAAAALKGARYTPEAKVSLAAARHAALAARPGTIKDEELEKERGGSGLRYSFDVLAHGTVYEVGIDAKTGAVLENGVDAKGD